MATRKQRALKLARRRNAQASHRGIRFEDNGDSRIQVPTGPTPAPGFRRTNPYEHGEELRRREQVVSFCARLGFDPTQQQIETMRALISEGRLTEKVITTMASREQAQEVFDAAANVVYDSAVYGLESEGKTLSSLDTIAAAQKSELVHADEVELMTHEELEQDAWDRAAYEQRMGWPTPAQWADLEQMAKAKKKGARGYVRVLEDAGFVLGKNEDPKDRKSWVKA